MLLVEQASGWQFFREKWEHVFGWVKLSFLESF
jgi:hypothetical protein